MTCTMVIFSMCHNQINIGTGSVEWESITDCNRSDIIHAFAPYYINYDLRWNPVRLMQRIGRVDRRLDPAVEA